jgi:hypothetical protein
LPDGNIVVADAGNELRFYAPTGRFLHAVGRGGEGPGEFRTISLLRRYRADSLIIWDIGLRRLTILSQSGLLGRIVAGPRVERFYYFADAFSDGSLLGMMDPPFSLEAARPGLLRTPVTYFRFDPASGDVALLGAFREAESYVSMEGGKRILGMPLGFRAAKATVGTRWYYGWPEEYEIQVHDMRGGLLSILRLTQPPVRLTDELIGSYIERQTSRVTDDNARRVIERRFREVPFHANLPAFGPILSDADGNLWVAEYAFPGDVPRKWVVIDPTGRIVAHVTTPPGLSVEQIGSDYILGITEDSLGVERVELFPLTKPDRP